LASVGIVSDSYHSEPRFSPHNRDFFLMPTSGEFSYEDETIETFNFPTVGAEKFSKNYFQSVGVSTQSGVLATGVYTDIIDSAREKKDGVEIVVYTIGTRKGRYSFYWSDIEHYKMDKVVDPGHFEKVGDILYFLSGDNSLGGERHYWEFLSQGLIDRVRSKEGIIVRMSGKEYRIPWKHSATFLVRDGVACDFSRSIEFKVTCDSGLHDFHYNGENKRWEYFKSRPDKVRADNQGGIMDMLNHASTLDEFIKNVPVSRLEGLTPMNVLVVPFSQDRGNKISQSADLEMVKIRTSGGYKQPDSYRKIILEDLSGALVSTFRVCPLRSNIICSNGRVVIFKRHLELLIVKVRDKYYVSNSRLGIGRVKIIRLNKNFDFALNINGPTLRLYEVDMRIMYYSNEEWEKMIENFDKTHQLINGFGQIIAN